MPLLTREGEVELAKRIQRGKLAVLRAISRTPTVANALVSMGEQLKNGVLTIQELVVFQDEVTEGRIDRRAGEVIAQTETIRKARLDVARREKKVGRIPKHEKTRYRRNYRNLLRAQVALSRLICCINFTESVKRRLVDDVRESIHGVHHIGCEIEHLDRQLKAKTGRRNTKEDSGASCGGGASSGPSSGAVPRSWNSPVAALERTLRTILRGEMVAEVATTEMAEANCVSWCRLPRSTPTAGCSCST